MAFPFTRGTTGEEELPIGVLRLRALRFRDYGDWARIRIKDEEHLRPVEPTVRDWGMAHTAGEWLNLYGVLKQYGRQGRCMPYVIELDGRFIGQITVGGIEQTDAWVGYWVDSDYTGHGIATMALAMMVDFVFSTTDLHRLYATYLPNNPASGRVLSKVGFRREGYLRRNIHIDGRWQDHYLMGLIREDCKVKAVTKVRENGAPEPYGFQ
ncbi:MAG: GNAT family protein [Corynebacterium sp.]|nr:GNAT family protein [Corynebacterium sp.]